MDTPDERRGALLPPAEETEGLLAHLASIVTARGPGPLVSGLVVEPSSEYFPDPWSPTIDGVEHLARRLLGYAGLGDLEIVAEAPRGEAAPEECAFAASGLPVWFAGLSDGRVSLVAEEEGLDDSELAAASLCHAIAHAYRVHHRVALTTPSEGTYRDQPGRRKGAEALEERLADVTAVYLGFGVLAANGALTRRTSGRMTGTYASWKMTTTRVGTLGPHAASFLLGAQAVARGLDARARKRLAGHLETNQAAYFEAACTALSESGAEALRARLGLPDPSAFPPPPDLAALTAPLAPGRRPRPARKKRRENEGTPVFRVRKDNGVFWATIFCVAALPVLALLSGGSFALTGAGAALALLGGYRFGRGRHEDECASCEAALPIGADRCGKCGGRVVGEIARRQDRLAALESYEDKQKDGKGG